MRLQGLDLARYLAFVGMVIVNFRIVVGASESPEFAWLALALEGRAAATFVVLAGIGLGLAAMRTQTRDMVRVTLRRAVFLMVVGLINSLIFDADILHYYAVYFVFGLLFLRTGYRSLYLQAGLVSLIFVLMLLVFDYDRGWDWDSYTYGEFWTAPGFIRNLMFNGWHPFMPWLAFLLVGMGLAQRPLGERAYQIRMIVIGAGMTVLAYGLAAVLASNDPELRDLVTTAPIPPMPLYILAGTGVALMVIGLCLLVAPALERLGILGLITPAGRHTLTLYIAHILIGMGVLEALGMLDTQGGTMGLIAALVFCLCATLFSYLWNLRFKRGPLEAIMRKTAG